MRKETAVIAVIVAAVAGFFVGNMTATRGAGEGDAEPTAEAGAAPAEAGAENPDLYRVAVGSSPAKGPADALVTIVEFSDFQCPFCSRVIPTLDQIQREYRGKVRIVFKQNPLPMHAQAPLAAEAALAANAQGKFWQYHDKLWENQRALERADLERYATQVGLDLNRFKAALDSHEFKRQVDADMALAAQLGARGTPSFFVNGRPLRGAQPFEAFKTVIDEEVTRAQRLLATGVAKNRLYAELTKSGLTKAAAPGAAGGPSKAGDRPARPREDPNARYKVPVRDRDAVRGPATALVTVVVFSEFQCPFCGRVRESLHQVEEHYGNKVRVVFKHNPLPFHQNAMPASEAALAAHAQGKFWQMHDKLFENQQTLTREKFEEIAGQIGLNMARFRADLDGHAGQAQIQEDQQLAQSLGARGTPSFFINGRKLRGAQPFEGFKTVIDEEIAKAEEAMRTNRLRANQVYEFMTKDGATAPVLLPGAPGAAAGPDRPVEDPNRVYEIADNPRAPTKGGRNARVVIQEFTDFQCPFCGRVTPTLRQLEEEYGDRIRIVFRNFPLPFHDKAMLAHEAAMEAHRQGKFWPMHDKLFENQRALERADLERYAQEVGLDMARFRAALDGHTHRAAIDADMEASRTSGARHGTPAFFINGRLLQGAQPVDAFKAAIDAALAAPAAPRR